ncbi:MAG: Asp-tRNA(Asn)/Glu-tRNA(Gln) amidotransferase subunit GatB [Sphingobacteriales bacterium]|nr:MAG: Asp-tRNA(Asn)/Glu-tRNA(Gln) amidotransferase subunit GatB [Sphingobacteriales bacterium]
MSVLDKYEVVIGLEVHAQLNTKSKIFTSDSTAFGAEPNTQINPITLGMPGVLPKMNIAVIEKAVKMGVACNCTINEYNFFDRKNYFYADLPKGYQISQDKQPICIGGYVEIKIDKTTKKINLTRIHLEEDAGKLNHELDAHYSLVDLNRAGIPLIEIVSEPDIRNSEEAYQYLTEVRKLVRYIDVCDGNMEEGSMRCDANVSVRLKGETNYRTRVEVKNMNSIRNVKRAIDIEVKRQVEIYESGGTIAQETRSFNPNDGSSFPLRTKEDAHDYRYFPEPDLPLLHIPKDTIEAIKQNMPLLPNYLYHKFIHEYNLSEYDAQILTDEREIASFYLEIIQHTKNYKSVANWLINDIKSYLNENNLSVADLKISSNQIADIIALVDANEINSTNSKLLFSAYLNGNNKTAKDLAIELNLIQSNNEDELMVWAKNAIENNPAKVAEYKKGKQGLLAMFVGDVMKASKGKADPKRTNQLLLELLDN